MALRFLPLALLLTLPVFAADADCDAWRKEHDRLIAELQATALRLRAVNQENAELRKTLESLRNESKRILKIKEMYK